MKPRDRLLAEQLNTNLLRYDGEVRPLLGIGDDATRGVLIEQLVESMHRVRYVSLIKTRDVSPRRGDPDDALFDPVKAAVLHQRLGDLDEAFWCVFLFVHFGRHSRGGYRYAREVYGRLGDTTRWNWANTCADPTGLRRWLDDHEGQLRRKDVPGGFGNHRKYESLSGSSDQGTGAAVESYVNWVGPPRTHAEMMREAIERAGDDPRGAFDILYWSMATVVRFGRTARFDYLTMVGKLGLALIEPGSTYMHGATGPYIGARMLFGENETAVLGRAVLDGWLVELGDALGVGMQVVEDALCNWQKSPARFIAFRA